MTSFCAQFSHNHVDLLRHAAPCAVIIDLKIDLEPVYVPLGLVIQRLLVEFITCLARSFEAYAVVGFHADNNEPLRAATGVFVRLPNVGDDRTKHSIRSEEHTSELQSRENLVCRLLLEKKNTYRNLIHT